MTPAQTLADGIAALSLSLDDRQQRLLLDYLDLLAKWNRAFNLTAVREPVQMVSRHLLDSLAILPWLNDSPTLDVGTGAGLPGIALAVARPTQTFTLLDSNGKKTRFVRQAVRELGLANVEVVQSRVEQYRNASAQVVSRAFASIPDMLALTGHLLAPGGRLLAMKGTLTDLEMAGIQAPWRAEVIPLSVPGLDEARHLVLLERDTEQD